MGKTSKPLTLRIHPSILHWPEWETLSSQGHTILTDVNDADLIIGPTSWYLTEDHRKYVETAIKAAREVRYPKEGK